MHDVLSFFFLKSEKKRRKDNWYAKPQPMSSVIYITFASTEKQEEEKL